MTWALVMSAVAGGTVAILGVLGSPATLALGALFPGVIALLSGAVLAWDGFRGLSKALYRQLLGSALIIWSVGQLWNGVAVAISTPVFPTPGDLISFIGAPLAVWGVLAVPRSAPAAHPAWRLGLDSGLLGVTLALPCWHFFFATIFASGPFGASDLTAVVVLVADITVVCVAALAYVRDLDPALLLTSLGAAFYTTGDLINMHATLLRPGQWPWPGAVLWCLAWPLIAAGLLRYSPAPLSVDRGTRPVDPDARGVTVTTAASLTLLMLSLGALVHDDRPDRVSISLVIVAVAVFWARELLNARFRSTLLRQLHAEATADPLTGLANRRVLAARMSNLAPGEPWCLLTVDLDGFKDVNDLLGHATGDLLLAAVAHRLREAAPPGALVSRIGGDEFAVLLAGDIDAGTQAGEQIITAVRQSAADVEGVTRVEVSASVGVAAVFASAPTDRVIDLTAAGRAADAALASSEILEVAAPSPVAPKSPTSHRTASNGVPPNRTVSTGTASNGVAAKETVSTGTASTGVAAKGTASNGAASNGAASNGAASNGAASPGTGPNGVASNGTGQGGTVSTGVAPVSTSSNGMPSKAVIPNAVISNGAVSNGAPPNGAVSNGAASAVAGNGAGPDGTAPDDVGKIVTGGPEQGSANGSSNGSANGVSDGIDHDDSELHGSGAPASGSAFATGEFDRIDPAADDWSLGGARPMYADPNGSGRHGEFVAAASTPSVAGPPTVVDPLGALSASGAALRKAKAGGRNRVEVYDAAVAQIRQRRLRVEERLRFAVETGAIRVLFQPIVDLRRGMVAGAEALARWTDPELGRVDPGEFITVAEQTGLVVEIGEQILESTLSQGVAEGLFDRGLRLSCNVSPVQLRVPGFHRVVQEAMASHGVNREQLVIEVTEQVLVEEGQAAQTLHRLAGLGVTIAIDDFGTGYSALGYLQRLPADILKIDRSLTSSLVAEPRSRAITRAVLDLGRTVGVSVVVEGVETSQVDDLVRRMGVGFGQGMHYGAAMSGADLAAMADRLSAAKVT